MRPGCKQVHVGRESDLLTRERRAVVTCNRSVTINIRMSVVDMNL